MTSVVEQFVEHQRELAKSKGRRFRIAKPPRGQPPDQVERAYRAYLLGIVSGIREAVEETLVPLIDGLVRESGTRQDARYNLADLEATLEAVTEQITLRVNTQNLRGLESAVNEYRAATSLSVTRQLQRQIRRMISLDAFPPVGSAERTLLDSWVKANRKRIVAMTTEEIGKVEDIVRRGVEQGHRAGVIRGQISERWPKVEARAALIARDQVNKLHGNLTRTRQTSLGIRKYVWRTSRDERVRESHLEKEGKVFAWKSPPPDTGHPGQDINCRCTAEPFLSGETAPSKSQRDRIIAAVRAKRRRLQKALRERGGVAKLARENLEKWNRR